MDNFVDPYSEAPARIIIYGEDTNANTFGNQQLTLFNDYYGEYCYMPLLIYEGYSGKLILPILRAGRRNKALNISGLLKRLFAYLHKKWPRCVSSSSCNTGMLTGWSNGSTCCLLNRSNAKNPR